MVFLQGKTSKRGKNSNIWKLREALYGLADANPTWSLKICKEFTILGATVLKIDQVKFYLKEKRTLKYYITDLLMT